MKILGIESSCDETAAAVVENGEILLSSVVHTQIDIHATYGGVVPEVAARNHLEVINPVVRLALANAQCTWNDIDAIAVTNTPGLVGSLLIGSLTAQMLAFLHNIPLYPVHHVEAHVYANFITKQSGFSQEKLQLPVEQPKFPLLALIVSGGHTQLVLFRNHGDFILLGATRDDAVGEAFDKVAKILGFPYPGGPSIAKAAEVGNPRTYSLPKPKLDSPYEFSFSGLKTAVLRAVQHEVGVDITFPSHKLSERLTSAQRNDFAASFQHTAVDILVDATTHAFAREDVASVVIAGGVAANHELRTHLANRLPIQIHYAPPQLCTDNAAMVASLGYYFSREKSAINPLDIRIAPRLTMTAR